MNKSDQRTEQRPARVYHRRMVLFVIGLEIFFPSVMFIFYQSNKSLLISESESVNFDGVDVTCTVSIGVVEAMKSVLPEELLLKADQAIYDTKRLGRNRVCVEAW